MEGLDVEQDPFARHTARAEAQFMTQDEKLQVISKRNNYPRKRGPQKKVDPVTGELETSIPRRLSGYSMGFEKVFASTSVTLPIMAHSVFAELHTGYPNRQVYCRRFNGLNVVFDLKKWVYEKIQVPLNAYDLSYAEPMKARITDELRLLTAMDSLDSQTLARTRAVQEMMKGVPGVHSINDLGVTMLYARLKCRTCGHLLNGLETARKYKCFGEIRVQPDTSVRVPDRDEFEQSARSGELSPRRLGMEGLREEDMSFVRGVPGRDPNLEDQWYRPDERKHCMYHSRGYELWEAQRSMGKFTKNPLIVGDGHSEFARIYIASGKEPTHKLKMFERLPLTHHHSTLISF